MHRQDLADQAKGRQHHDVNRRVGIEPEKVLIHHGISAQGRIEEPGVGNDVEAEQHQGASQYRGGKHHQDAGAQQGPAEHRQLQHF